MPLGRRLARFNRRVTNRLTRPLAGWLPGFGVVVHIGRTTSRTYRTPVNVFRRGDGYVIALTYGARADWVQNVVAAGGCELITRGERQRLDEPRIRRDASRRFAPPLARPLLRLVDVEQFLELSRSESPRARSAPRRG